MNHLRKTYKLFYNMRSSPQNTRFEEPILQILPSAQHDRRCPVGAGHDGTQPGMTPHSRAAPPRYTILGGYSSNAAPSSVKRLAPPLAFATPPFPSTKTAPLVLEPRPKPLSSTKSVIWVHGSSEIGPNYRPVTQQKGGKKPPAQLF